MLSNIPRPYTLSQLKPKVLETLFIEAIRMGLFIEAKTSHMNKCLQVQSDHVSLKFTSCSQRALCRSYV